MNPFQRFSEPAKHVLTEAQEMADWDGHGEIRPEHLVIGVLRQPESLGARALRSLGVDLVGRRCTASRLASDRRRPGIRAARGADRVRRMAVRGGRLATAPEMQAGEWALERDPTLQVVRDALGQRLVDATIPIDAEQVQQLLASVRARLAERRATA